MPQEFVPNQVIRPATAGDAEGVAELIVRSDQAEGAPRTVTTTDVTEDWERPLFEIGRDTVLLLSGDRVVAYGEVWEKQVSQVSEVFNVVDPACRGLGIGSFLIDWSEKRAPGRIHNFVSAADEAARSLLAARAYTPIRHFWHMEISLEGRSRRASSLPGIEIRAIDGKDDERAVHTVTMEAFAQHWGFVNESFDEWWGAFARRSDFDPELILLATDAEGTPIGALVAQKGDGYGWVRDLGVLPEARGRGVGAALLERSFDDFAARGYPKVLLNVDSSNETGATRLYERVGMKQIRQFDCYAKER